MKLKLLQRKHAEYDAKTLQLYADLFHGGAMFRKNAKEYLPKNDVEPDALHKRRVEVAHYLNYAARICNFFASWLFTSPLTFDPGTEDPESLGPAPPELQPGGPGAPPPGGTAPPPFGKPAGGAGEEPAAGAPPDPLAGDDAPPGDQDEPDADDGQPPAPPGMSPLPPDAGDGAPPPFGVANDPWYAEFKEDCDGVGTDFEKFIRQRFVDACVKRSAFVRVALRSETTTSYDGDATTGGDDGDAADVRAPRDGETRKDFRDAGGHDLALVPIDATDVINWRRKPDGSLAWLCEYTKRCELREFDDADETITECWTLYKADGTIQRWEREQQKRGKDGATAMANVRAGQFDDVREVDAPHNPLDGEMPIVELRLPSELWLMDNLADAQLEHFRARNALSWAIARTCYVMATLKTATRRRPQLGSGYFMQLGPKDEFAWPAPPTAPYEVIKGYAAEIKDELHRVADQMAQGTDNSAAALGRSADSKEQDNSATKIVLGAYGALVRDTVERVMDKVSRARGDEYEWTIGGMDNYQSADAKVLTDTAVAMEPLNIPSPTFKRELHKKLALAVLPDADENTRARIAAEIDHHTVDEHVINPVLQKSAQASAAGIDPQDAVLGRKPEPPPGGAEGDEEEDGDAPPPPAAPPPRPPMIGAARGSQLAGVKPPPRARNGRPAPFARR